VPPHVSLQPEVPKNDGWKEIFHSTVSQQRGWPNLSLPDPLPINPIDQDDSHSLVQSSHASKRLKIEAHHAIEIGKSTASPSSPSNGSDKYLSSRMHLRDDCSHVISEIRPKGSLHPKENSGKSKGDNNNQGKISSQSGKYGF
jgi:hypothetical protein